MAKFIGTDGGERIDGTEGIDAIYGLGGGDYLLGANGADHLNGGDGEDALIGWGGSDLLVGGNDNDYLVGDYDSVPDDGQPYSGDGNDRLYGGPGNDTLDGGPGNDRIDGGTGDDLIIDGIGSNVVTGRAGDDQISGAGRLYGDDGNDYLRSWGGLEAGGRGFDWLDTGGYAHGAQIHMNGGADGDTFQVFLNGTDDPAQPRTSIAIDDFHRGQGDQLHLAAGATVYGTPFSLSGADLFNAFDSNRSGQLGDGDAHAFQDGHGGVTAQWFNVDLNLHGDATAASDWLS